MWRPVCPCCHKSDAVIRKGRYKNKSTGRSYRVWYCKRCKHKFVPENLCKRKRHRREIIIGAVDLRKDGLSCRKVARQINGRYSTKISASTVLRWTREQSKLLQEFERSKNKEVKIRGKVHIDEAFVKINGVQYYYVCARDAKTKYNLQGILVEHRYLPIMNKFFKNLKYNFANRPKHVVIDKCEVYRTAFNKYFRRIAKLTFGVPIACKKFGLKHNNNCIERYNGYVKDAGRLTRGYKDRESTFDYLELNRICLNWLNPLDSLKTKKGKRTPAEAAGIKFRPRTYKELITAAAEAVYY